MDYGDFKDLTRRTVFHKILCDKAFSIAKIPKYDGYQSELASMVYKFFDKKTSGETVKNENIFWWRISWKLIQNSRKKRHNHIL